MPGTVTSTSESSQQPCGVNSNLQKSKQGTKSNLCKQQRLDSNPVRVAPESGLLSSSIDYDTASPYVIYKFVCVCVSVEPMCICTGS